MAQIAACIGREFDYELLAAVAQHPEAALTDALDKLATAELVFRRGTPPDARYTFKHSLVRDAAYESLLMTRRRAFHGRIGRALVENTVAQQDVDPMLVARHFLAADDPASAVPHLLRGIDTAVASAAGPEAQETIRIGLAAVAKLPQSNEATGWQAKFHLMLGDSLRNTDGTAAAQTGEAFRRARLAFARIGDEDGHGMALFGAFLSHFNGARLDQADEVAGLLRAMPARGETSAGHWHRHEASGLAEFVRGRFAAAVRHLEALPDAAGPYPYRPSAGLVYLPWSLFVLGYPDRAFRLDEEAIARAASVGRKFELAASLGNGCYLPQLGGRLELLAERATCCIEQRQQVHLKIWQAIGSVFLGWLAGRDGDFERGDALVEPALRALYAASHRIEHGYLSSLRADLLRQAGRVVEARTVLEQSLAEDSATGEQWFDAELHRMLGAGADSVTAAEHHFAAALDLARQQQAKLWELRVSRDLARLWAERGERQRALDLLVPVYDWFSEGFATPDLLEAKALLDALR